MSNLLHQVSWSLLYIIGQREGRRGIFYSYENQNHRLNITRTEYELTIDLSNSSSSSETEETTEE